MSNTVHIRRGIRDVAPILPGIIPFGLIAGVTAIDAGLHVSHAVGLSVFVFAGASQMAAISLIGQNATIAVIILTTLVINARFLMYSASLSGHFAGTSTPKRMGAAYLLTDQAYAFSINRYREDDLTTSAKLSYYAAAGLTLWLPWQIATAAGALLGAQVPESWELDFAIPLVFLALLVPAVRDRSDGVAAALAALMVLVFAGLPYNLALPIAALLGIGAGVVSEKSS